MWLAGGCFFWASHLPVYAAGQTFQDAIAFYDTYGSGKIVFSDGAFYYSSRGKQGDPRGIRYGVAGQKFTMELEGKKRYVTEIALDGVSGEGSCKRISYVKKDGYYYSLYQVSYDRIFKRLQKKYPNVDFGRLIYNHQICFQIDFYLCLVIDGKEQGIMQEQENGRVTMTGTVYQNLDQILKAADWSEETRNALKNYYGIQLKVYQPSIWYISYHKNDRTAVGTMQRQEFTYGKAENLDSCTYSRVITVTLEPGQVTWKGERLTPIYTMLKSRFLGWSLEPAGKKQYNNEAQVKNLSDQHEDVIHMYALWSQVQMKFPEITSDEYEFLGWSRVKQEIFPSDAGEKEIMEQNFYTAGNSCKPDRDVTFYAVWKYKRYKVQFQTPESGGKVSGPIRYFAYDQEQILKIRKLITACGFAGFRLNQEIIGSGLA